MVMSAAYRPLLTLANRLGILLDEPPLSLLRSKRRFLPGPDFG
jgi:hypothetical protein